MPDCCCCGIVLLGYDMAGCVENDDVVMAVVELPPMLMPLNMPAVALPPLEPGAGGMADGRLVNKPLVSSSPLEVAG